jgi:hypothetical protein
MSRNGWVLDATEPDGSPLTSVQRQAANGDNAVRGTAVIEKGPGDDGSPLSSPIVDDRDTLPNGQRVPKGSAKYVVNPFEDGPGGMGSS